MAKPLTLPSAATLPAVLLEQAARQGRRAALRHKRLGVWRERSWAELADEVGRLAAALAGLGLGPGQRLLALTPPRPQTALLSLAAHWLGAEVAALDPALPAEALSGLIAAAQPAVTLIDGPAQRAVTLAALGEAAPVIYLDARREAQAGGPAGRAYAELLAGQAAPPALAATPEQTAFRFFRWDEHGGLETQALSHAFLLQEGGERVRAHGLSADERALAARAFATAEQARHLFAPWLLAGFSLNFPENLATRDQDRRELGPTLVAGTRETYGRLADDVARRLPPPGHWQRRLVDWALSGQGGAPGRALGYWLVRRPLLDVLGLIHTRHPLLLGPPLPAAQAEWFARLGVRLHALPDVARWQEASAPATAARPFVTSAGA